LAVYRG
ncbi:hypothetical protein S40288_09605, partial [Stachybotrys chartarum IBT 40288]